MVSAVKILFVHSLYPPHVLGGAELSVQTLVEGLANQGTEVVVLTTSDRPGLHEDVVSGIRVWRAGLRNVYWHFRHTPSPRLSRRIWHTLDVYNPLMASYVRRVVGLEQPNLASCHNLPGWSVSAWQSLKTLGIPTIQVLHDQYLLCPTSTMFKDGHTCARQCIACRLMRLPHVPMSRQVAAVVGVSRFILGRHRKRGYFEGVPVQRVIYNARSREALGLSVSESTPERPPYPLRFGFIGRLAPNKGIELLLRIFREQRISRAELLVAGSGYAEYERLLKEISASSAVRFLGSLKPREFFPQVDVAIVPSLVDEALGMTVAEAFAFGRPVIGSRRGGIPEMIADGVNGLLFDPDRPQELAQAMRRFAEDHELRSRMGAAARASATRFLDMNRFLDEYEAVYRLVLEQGKGTRVNSPESTRTHELLDGASS